MDRKRVKHAVLV
jgi:hypothetical protein